MPIFDKPSSLEHVELFRPGLGTENVAPLLRALIGMLRPNRILEIGAGYTSPFLLEAIVNNKRVLDDGNLNTDFLETVNYDPKFVIIDDMSLGDLCKTPLMEEVLSSEYVDLIPGKFQGQAAFLKKHYGLFDFVWFDCGGADDYSDFIEEYWDICSNLVIFHYTYSDSKPNSLRNAILTEKTRDFLKLELLEPHKRRQCSVTIFQKRPPG